MNKPEVLQSIDKYTLIAEEELGLTETSFTDKPPALAENELYVYLIIAIPEDTNKIVGYDGIKDTDTDNAYGAWVKLRWSKPDDAELVEHYRVYKTEVPSLSGLVPDDYSKLSYTMLKDRIKYTYCVDGVEQSIAHSYIYKIVPVSLWGVEGTPVYTPIRVPSTVPPAEPEMLLPNSRPGSVEVYFTAVAGATKYNIYRTTIETPGLSELDAYGVAQRTLNHSAEDIADVLSQDRVFFNKYGEDVIATIQTPSIDPSSLIEPTTGTNFSFSAQELSPSAGSVFFDDYKKDQTGPARKDFSENIKELIDPQSNVMTVPESPAATGENNLNKETLLKYSTLIDASSLVSDVSNMPTGIKRDILKNIVRDYGILSIASYSDLNLELASTIGWQNIGVINADSSMVPGQALEYTDRTAVFGKKYLYTVSASNDDLESTRPEPVEATCLKGEPFPEPPDFIIEGRYIVTGQHDMVWVNHISWNHVTSPYFSQEELERDWIAGYIVYRSNKKEGYYHQVSGILSKTEFYDATVSPFQSYYYRVKTVDTAGFITNFDTPGGAYAPPNIGAYTSVQSTGALQASKISIEGSERANIKGINAIFNALEPNRDDLLYGQHFYELARYIRNNNVTKLYLEEYVIEDINLAELALDLNTGHEDYIYALYGSGNLVLGPTKTAIPVNFVIKNLIYANRGTEFPPYWIYDAVIQLEYSTYLQPDTGIKFDSMDLEIESETRIEGSGLPGHSHRVTNVNTYPKVTGSYTFGGEFLGDTDVLTFTQEHLSGEGIITIKNTPVFRWKDYVLYDIKDIKLDLNAMNKNSAIDTTATGFPVVLNEGKAEKSMYSPTIDNKGLEYTFASIGMIPGDVDKVFCPNRNESQKQAISTLLPGVMVNLSGNLSGLYGTLTGKADTYMQLASPAGISLKMKSGKIVLGGQDSVKSASNLIGGVTLPFFEAPADLADGLNNVPRKSKMEQTKATDLVLSLFEGVGEDANVVLNQTILNLFDETIQGKMIVMDGRTYGLSYIPFVFGTWDGKGFLLNEKVLKPVLVGNYDIRAAVADLGGTTGQTLNGKKLYDVDELTHLVEDSFVVRSNDIGVDLSDTQSLPNLPTDKWYSDADWKGIILNEGSISLSRNVLTGADEGLGDTAPSISFQLAPREMIYDRNGFYYYNKLEPEGDPIKVSFGEGFGGFKDATMSYCEVEMYANQFELWIAGTVKVPAFGNQSVDYIMETDEDNIIRAYIMPKVLRLADPKTGPGGKTVDPVVLDIYGGFFNKKGANIEGSLTVNFPGQLVGKVSFCELVIPYNLWEMSIKREDLAGGEILKKGTAQLEMPYRTKFNGYATELRSFDLFARYNELSNDYSMGVYFSGGTALTNNMEMPDNNNARFFIGDINSDAEIVLEESKVHITMPVGGAGGIMSGEVTPAGDKERLSKAVGEKSEAYLALKEAQRINNESLAIAGKAQAIKNKIDTAISEINSALNDMDAFNDRLEAEIKSAMRGAVNQFESQRLAAQALIINNTRHGIDQANANINMANRQINGLNVYINEYAEIKPEDKEYFEKGAFPTIITINKKAMVDEVEAFTSAILDSESINKTEAQILAEIDAFKLTLFKGKDLSAYQIPITTDNLYITAVIEPANEILAEAKERLDEVVEYYEEANKYIGQLDKYFDGDAYPGFTIGENGIVEFNPKKDAFCMTLLKETNFLEGTDIQIEGRIGWKAEGKGNPASGAEEIDPDLFFYAFAVAYIPTPGENEKPKGIKMGSMELHNMVGMTAYNFIPPYSQGSGYTIGTGTAMLSTIANLEIDITNKGNSFFAVSADMYVKSTMAKHLFAIKDMLLFVASDGSFQVSGRMFGPSEISMLSKAGPNNSTTAYGSARLTYNAVHEAFEFRATIDDLRVAPGFKIAGTLGFDWGPKHWMLYLGYPETLKLTYEPWGLTGGFGLNLGVNPVTNNAVIKVKLDIGYRDKFDIGIVYARVSVYAMVLIGYGPWNMLEDENELRWFNKGEAFEGFAAGGSLSGEVVGGIRIPGVGEFDIIRLALDSHLFVVNPREDYTYLQDDTGYYYYVRTVDGNGNPVKDRGKWYLDAQIKISYHLDLWLVSFSDSFSFHYSTSFDMT
ncbi:MAG TPA: hypothetical protein VFC96_01100 [Anaerovoracaceae bacterium]|nr:hypothetical protein [Anaerovoracaceae bacterium]